MNVGDWLFDGSIALHNRDQAFVCNLKSSINGDSIVWEIHLTSSLHQQKYW